MSQQRGLRQLFQLTGFGKGGKVKAAWNPAGTLLCVCGNSGLVRVYDRSGQQVAEVTMESRAQCISLDWDKDGEVSVFVHAIWCLHFAWDR